MDSNTLDLRWVKEEEALLNIVDIPQPALLETVRACFLFVNAELSIVYRQTLHIGLELNIERNVSVLSKTVLLNYIEKAKQDTRERIAINKETVSFSIMDILIWNEGMEADYIHKCAESDPAFIEWTNTARFVHGSIFQDAVFQPSLFPFHSNQTVYVLLKETHKHMANGSRDIINKNPSNRKKTKRVHFSPTISVGKPTRRCL
jgi:hypothetical protein